MDRARSSKLMLLSNTPTRQLWLRSRRQPSSRERAARRALAPLAVLTLAWLLARDGQSPLGSALLVTVTLAASYRLSSAVTAHAGFLPLMRTVRWLASPALAFCVLLFLKASAVVAGLTVTNLLALCGLSAVLSPLAATAVTARRPRRARRSTVVAVIGTPRTASDLAAEISGDAQPAYEVAGYVDTGSVPEFEVGEHAVRLGSLEALRDVVVDHHVDLLLIAGDAPRLTVFDAVATSCVDLPVRVIELSAFYEKAFGHVPLTEINAAWFQWAMHPRYESGISAGKRLLDLVIAGSVAVLAGPLLVLLALTVRRDGGPVLYRQTRIGESGRPFEIFKLRSMRPAPPVAAERWAAADDDRVTVVGRLMRRTHLDELPQIVNVLRGEMSIVGPRPEQPGFVDRLETAIPFYSRRHLGRPGITGWAQVQCGYAGSDEGSAWKLCHDLYYLKHGSVMLDLLILGETLRTLLADRQYTHMPERRFVITGSTAGDAEPELATAHVA